MQKVKLVILGVFIAIFLASLAIALYTPYPNSGLDLNCSTTIHYDHKDPDFTSMIELNLRLFKNRTGRAILAGRINANDEIQTISRSIVFNYDMTHPDEISVRNFDYIKNTRDTANDAFIRSNFFYAPEGVTRQMRLTPSENAWLIGNLQSPFALCVNKYD